jgi:hypothetical protein
LAREYSFSADQSRVSSYLLSSELPSREQRRRDEQQNSGDSR